MKRYYFVGERPSPTAMRRGWRWEHGRLAAKQLFDALLLIGINPSQCRFDNAFDTDSLARIRTAVRCDYVIVAMGKKCQQFLAEHAVPFLALVHPAARGEIRRKDRYAAHVKIAVAVFSARLATALAEMKAAS